VKNANGRHKIAPSSALHKPLCDFAMSDFALRNGQMAIVRRLGFGTSKCREDLKQTTRALPDAGR